jgi:anthranilate synthase component 1
VIHLVSKVTAIYMKKLQPCKLLLIPSSRNFGGAKHRTMQLIENTKKTNRNFLWWSNWFHGFEGNFNHAIMIRTFLSKTTNCIVKLEPE